MQRALMIGMVALVLTGCGTNLRDTLRPSANRVLFDGLYYPARLARDKEDRAAFTVTVSRATQGIDGAREAARHEAVKYCVAQYGNSDAVWTVGPDSEGLTVRDDQITFAGRCKG